MRIRQQPDSLTQRESEVLALVRRGLTNEEIAQRLEISFDGAKYHVSQILSKLGVNSRDEAAAIVTTQHRPWWLSAALWLKVGGAATVTVTVAGLALLAWGAVRTGGPADESIPRLDPEAEALIQSVAEATLRPGVLHIKTSTGSEIWINSERQLFREQSGEPGTEDYRVSVGEGWNVTTAQQDRNLTSLLPTGEAESVDRAPPSSEYRRINHPIIFWLEPLRLLSSAESVSISSSTTPEGFEATIAETRSRIESGEAQAGAILEARIEMWPDSSLVHAYQVQMVGPEDQEGNPVTIDTSRVEYTTFEFLQTHAFSDDFFSPDVLLEAHVSVNQKIAEVESVLGLQVYWLRHEFQDLTLGDASRVSIDEERQEVSLHYQFGTGVYGVDDAVRITLRPIGADPPAGPPALPPVDLGQERAEKMIIQNRPATFYTSLLKPEAIPCPAGLTCTPPDYPLYRRLEIGFEDAFVEILTIAHPAGSGFDANGSNNRDTILLVAEKLTTAVLSPAIGDHWHAAYAIFIGDERQPDIPAFTGPEETHTHGDGIIHIHPFIPAGEGAGASLGRFFQYGNGELSPDTLQIPGQSQVFRAGDAVPGDGRPGVIRILYADRGMHPFGAFSDAISVCDSLIESDYEETGPDYVPQEGDCVRIIFGQK